MNNIQFTFTDRFGDETIVYKNEDGTLAVQQNAFDRITVMEYDKDNIEDLERMIAILKELK